MTYHTLSFPPALQAWVDARIAEGMYADVADYLYDLVRQDARNGDERARLRAMIEEGLASGVIDRDPRDIINDIIAEDPDLRD
jgi:antitoxin ParD1/3/4